MKRFNHHTKYNISILSFKVALLFFFCSSANSIGQTYEKEKLDSLYNVYTSIRSHSHEAYPDRITYENPTDIKCGFGLVNAIRINFQFFAPEQQAFLSKLLQRPIKQKSITTPSGFFRIHFDTTGSEIPAYDVDLLAAALDSSYQFEVNYLGFPSPPKDSEGGDDLYDVYIINLGLYGQTVFSTNSSDKSSYMEIDNRMNFFTNGIDAARVTVAHEFHHAIQVGSYGFRDEDLFFYELTSTSMEEFVFDDVNDYYNYQSDYFQNTGRSFASNNGYNLAIWNLFLKERFGFSIFKRQWELMPQVRALDAINTSISENNSSLNSLLNDFGVWTYFTKERSIEGEYFDEAQNYPLVKPIMKIQFTPPEQPINYYDAKPLSNSFINIINSSLSPDDTIDILISNSDYKNGIVDPGSSFSITYKLFDYPAEGSKRLNENLNYYSKTEVNTPSIWSTAEFRNGELINTSKYFSTADFPYPSPFRYGRNNFIFIPVKQLESDIVDFNVYSSSMNLIYSKSKNITRLNEQGGIMWDVLDNKNKRISTGVYVYIIKSGDEIIKGKIVIFNE